jgi:hypothetical protein
MVGVTGRMLVVALSAALVTTLSGCVASTVFRGPDAVVLPSLKSTDQRDSNVVVECRSLVPPVLIHPLLPGQRPEHSAPAAIGVAHSDGVGPIHVTRTFAAVVTDPLAGKLGISTGPRLMWVIVGYIDLRPTRDGEPTSESPPSRRSLMTLVDDQTLKPGGSFSC